MAATVMICGAFLFTSCIGSFGLHSKLVNWNQSIGNKFVNELVFLAFNIIPVYGVCYLADALVINSIELPEIDTGLTEFKEYSVTIPNEADPANITVTAGDNDYVLYVAHNGAYYAVQGSSAGIIVAGLSDICVSQRPPFFQF